MVKIYTVKRTRNSRPIRVKFEKTKQCVQVMKNDTRKNNKFILISTIRVINELR